MKASHKIIACFRCVSLSFGLLLLAPLACTSVPKPTESLSADASFEQLRQNFVTEYLRLFPVTASVNGEHSYDAEWGDYSKGGEQKVIAFYQNYRTALGKIDQQLLNKDNQVDAAVLGNEINYRLFDMESLGTLRYSPLAWLTILSSGLDTLATHEYGTPAARARALIKRFEGVPAIVAAARDRLEAPPRLETQTAIEQADGLLGLCQSGIDPLLKAAPESAADLQKAAQIARASIEELKSFLQKTVLPRSNRDFRLGQALYARKMQYDLVDTIEPAQLAAYAREALDRTLSDMYQVALSLSHELLGKAAKPSQDKKVQRKLVRAVLDRLALEQPTDATLFTASEKAIADATAFIREKKILTVPDEKCQVIRMPAFNAGFAGAYSQSSGPFDSKFENFVAIEPPLAADRESFYREYNSSMLVELMLHEAVPGHCLQAMHAVKSRHPIRAIFGNGPYAEGWAMYSEEVMAHHGFGGARIRLSQLKLLARAISNTILDYEVHTQNMSEKDAMRLMMEETFQERAEAEGKWRRVQLSSVQLTTYFYGYQQFVAMRQAAEKQAGFNELAFHDQLLGAGGPPLKLLRARFGL